MAKEPLSDRQKTILLYSQFYYHEGPEKIGSISGIPAHQVRYDLRTLIDRGVLLARRQVNESRLGRYLFHLHLSVKSQDADRLLQVLKSSSRVLYLSRNGGERSIGVTILSRTPELIFRLMDEAAAKSNVNFSQVGWAVEGTFYHFGIKSLGGNAPELPVTVQDPGENPIAIDFTDARVLQLLRRGASYNASELARTIGVPASTIQYRLKRLEEQGVILPLSAFIDYSVLGLSEIEFLIHASQASTGEHQRLIQYCHKHPSIPLLIRSFGDWQYKFICAVERPSEIFELEDNLLQTFPDFIQKITVMSRRKTVKTGDFPAEDFE
jgi:Lrp/AsnC family leucine-responsive transcriptional regulator